MVFVSRLCGPIALLFFVATFNLSYSFAVRNGQSTGNMDSPPSAASSLLFDGLNANQTDLTPDGDNLREQLYQKAMEVLEKEERVYDLESQKLELEIAVLKKELAGNETVEESQSEVNETLQESTTPLSTEPSTEVSTEVSTEASTEPSTEASTEPSTEASTEPSTEASTEPATDVTTEASTTVVVMTEDNNETLTTVENIAVVQEQAFTDAFVATTTASPKAALMNASLNLEDPQTGSTQTASVTMKVPLATAEPTSEATTTQEPSSTVVVRATTKIIDAKSSTSFEFLKSAGEPVKTSISAVALSLIATVVVLKF